MAERGTAEITVPADLLPRSCQMYSETLKSILNLVFTEFAEASGKGYTADGKRIETQVDVSLAGHTLSVLTLFLSLLKAYEEEGVEVNPRTFLYSAVAIALHDLNKYLEKSGYEELELDELIKEVRGITAKHGISLSDEEILAVICLLERAELGSTGRYCRSFPPSLRDKFSQISIRLIRLADQVASLASSTAVDDYQVSERIKSGLHEIDRELGTNLSERIGVKRITNSIYNLAKYLTLVGLVRTIREGGGVPLLVSRNSVIYLGEDPKDEDVVSAVLDEVARNLRPTFLRKRPDQSNIDYPSLAFRVHGKDFEEVYGAIKEFFEDEARQGEIADHFQKYVWFKGDGPEEFTAEGIIERIEELGERRWLGYLVLYSLCNIDIRKGDFFSKIFGKRVSIPISAGKPEYREKYREIYGLIFEKLFQERWLIDHEKEIVSALVDRLTEVAGDELNAIEVLIKHHLEPGPDIGGWHEGVKGETCALCGRSPAPRDYKGVDPIPIASLVSNFYPNLIRPGSTKGIGLCDLCFGEVVLRKKLLGRQSTATLYLHATPSPYFPVLRITSGPHVEQFSFGEGKVIKGLEGRIVNPEFAVKGGATGALVYFMVAAGRRDGATSVREAFNLVNQAVSWSRAGFRVEVTKALSPHTYEKHYLSFENIPGALASYLKGTRFYFDEIKHLSKRVELASRLRTLSGRRVEDILSSLSSNILSSFHFLVLPLPKKRKSVLEVGKLAEEVVGASYEGVLPIVEELARMFVERFRGGIDIDSRNSRTWPIRDAFETYLKFYRLREDELRDMVASQILKSSSGEGVNLKSAESFAENFANKFIELIKKFRERVGVHMIDPSLRTYLIDAFDYYVVKEVLKGG